IRGEARSHDAKFVKVITRAWKEAFTKAGGKVKDDRGRTAKVQFTSRLDYYPFRLREKAAVVRHAQAAARMAGWETTLRIGNGGLDANWMVKHGIPTITFGAGQNNIHTIDEYVDLAQFEQGCRMALALALYSAEERESPHPCLAERGFPCCSAFRFGCFWLSVSSP